ncbi:3'-5' exonuclease [Denitratisoma oestradiolicum]|uniref:Exonuclease RNase T and DNA polymerase III n=1 Tax=Denitratisoma oestradiolicum TaxID=311182 RepID=A0A6S6XZL2_9PROT|nr:3'-5' exonuclease [Denitratisoma oestradiolicum]CAB1370413.1 Exonuclease RNase T and DNA polymerase III [Denitratisoma oestradiolicum]
MSLLRRLQGLWWRRRLLRSEFRHLFDEPPDGEWVAVDCETTGLDTARDEIVSIGAVPIRGQQILTSKRLELLVRPTLAPSASSIRIHHLREMDVQGGLAPDEAIHRFLEFVGPRPLVGYYLEFDVAMLDRLARPYLGIPLPQRKIEVSALYYDYKYRQNPDASIDLRFATILKDLDLPRREEHDAFNDALMAAQVFVKLHHQR